MSEPSQVATRVETIAPGLLHWSVADDRIGARSEAYALAVRGRTVLVDPLRLAPRALAAVTAAGPVAAIVLTIQSHQRAAWRYRNRFGVEVHAPRGAEGLEEQPDRWYDEGATLPGGLKAIHAPGPCDASFALRLERRRGGILFLGDLLVRGDDGQLGYVPDIYQDAPRKARASARRLVGPPVAVLCPGHGAPIVKGAAQALEAAAGRARKPGR